MVGLYCWSARANPCRYSFPTRRSSDLWYQRDRIEPRKHGDERDHDAQAVAGELTGADERHPPPGQERRHHRSEEHTSELQSRENLVCRLLLEKKNRSAASACNRRLASL